jgi:hypothetical protein
MGRILGWEGAAVGSCRSRWLILRCSEKIQRARAARVGKRETLEKQVSR